MSTTDVHHPVNKRRIGLAIVSGFLLDVLNKISPLFILHHAQSFLGLAAFGSAQWTIALIETIQPIIYFGYTNYAMAEIGKSGMVSGFPAKLLSRVNLLKMIHIFALLLFFLVWMASGATLNFSSHQIYIIGLVCVSVALDATWYGLYAHKLSRLNFVGGVIRVIALFAILARVRSADDLGTYTLFILLPNIVISFATGVYAFRCLGGARVSASDLRDTFKASAPFGAVVVLYIFFDRFDLFLVEKWFGSEQLGAYAGASRVVQSLILLTGSIVMAFYAENIHIKEPNALQSHVSLNLWLLMSLAIPVMFGAPFVAHDVMNFLFPNAPTETHGLFWVLALGFVGNVLITVFGLQLLLLQARVASMISALVVGLVSGLLIAVLFKESLGLYSCAWGVVTGKWIAATIITFNGTQLITNLPWTSILRPLIAGIFMVMALLLIQPVGLVLTLLAGGFFYLAGASFLNQDKIRVILNLRR